MDLVTYVLARKAARTFDAGDSGKALVVGADGVAAPAAIAAGEIVIDTTLAIQGAAADAAATGAAIALASGQVTVETPAAGTTFTLDPCPVTYNFGERAELTLTLTSTTQYHFMFACPSGSATVLTMSGITGIAGDTSLAAGKTYEVDVWAGVALFNEIEVTAVE